MNQEPETARNQTDKEAKLILIVDDEVDITNTFAMLFGFHGYKTITAPDGRAALDLVKKQRPDVIISDCMMPTMSGVEFSRHVRADPVMNDIPIILMSAAPGKYDLSEFPDLVFMQKPFRFADLLAEVGRLLRCG